jgi:hypothetical protein
LGATASACSVSLELNKYGRKRGKSYHVNGQTSLAENPVDLLDRRVVCSQTLLGHFVVRCHCMVDCRIFIQIPSLTVGFIQFIKPIYLVRAIQEYKSPLSHCPPILTCRVRLQALQYTFWPVNRYPKDQIWQNGVMLISHGRWEGMVHLGCTGAAHADSSSRGHGLGMHQSAPH